MLLIELMGDMDFDACAVQAYDLQHGLDSLFALGTRHGLPFLCSNLERDEAPSGLPGWRVFDFPGLKVGVLAVTDPLMQRSNLMPDGLLFVNPIKAMEDGVANLRVGEGCDIVVLLYGGRRDQVMEICDKVEGIDVAFFGNASNSQRVAAETDTGTRVLTAANRGKDFGQLQITLKDDGSLEVGSFIIHELDEHYPDDPGFLARVDAFKKVQEEEKRKARLIEELARKTSEVPTADIYLGSTTCGRCHTEEFDSFLKTDHAFSMNTLKDISRDNDPDCISCHVTGWGIPGGYGLDASNRDMLQHVQCEACHGYGTRHSRDGAYSGAARKSCATCHDSDRLPDDENHRRPFDFDTDWARIRH